jgi:dihydroflavonol-4-reductase
MKALVTGADGFIGAAVARALVRTGIEVRMLARPDSDLRNLDGLPVEHVAGDLPDPASLRTALAGCRHLHHVAAHYALWIRITTTE